MNQWSKQDSPESYSSTAVVHTATLFKALPSELQLQIWLCAAQQQAPRTTLIARRQPHCLASTGVLHHATTRLPVGNPTPKLSCLEERKEARLEDVRRRFLLLLL